MFHPWGMLLICSVLPLEDQGVFYELMSDLARVLVVQECCWTADVAASGDLKWCSVTLPPACCPGRRECEQEL